MADTNIKRLKIGIIFDDSLDKPDGVQQYILSVGNWLTAQGHKVHYLVGETTRTDIAHVHSLSKNINVSFNGNKMSIPLPVNRAKLKTLLQKEAYDVLHVQMPYSPWLAHRLITNAPASTAVIGTFHIVAYSKLVTVATKFLAWWTGKSLQRFSSVMSVSPAAQNYALETYGLQTDILPNVFDFPRFNQAQPILKPVQPKKRILFLGRLVERKGCQYLLEAVKLLSEQNVRNFEVIICGKGHLLPKLKNYAETHDLPVTFTGFVSEEEKPGYMASADIAVFPSTGGESFGIVLIEAMASGRAAVLGASNSGYASVLHEREDLQFDVADATGLARKLEIMLSDEKYRQETAVWGAQYAKQFDIAVVGNKLIEIYDAGIVACAKQTHRR